MNVVRGTMEPSLLQYSFVLDAASKLLKTTRNQEATLDLCKAFSFLSDGDNDVSQRFNRYLLGKLPLELSVV